MRSSLLVWFALSCVLLLCFPQSLLAALDKNVDPSMSPDDYIPRGGLGQLDWRMAEVYNKMGKYLDAKAAEMGVEAGALAAVLSIESGGSGFVNNRLKIRFEAHVFKGRCGCNDAKMQTRFKNYANWQNHQFLDGGQWVNSHGSQDMEHKILDLARSWNEVGGLESISMGAPQVMGFNFKSIGYGSVREMYDAFSSSIRPQMDAFVKFIRDRNGCLNGMKQKNFRMFATCYNGAGREDIYGPQMQDSYDAYVRVMRQKTGAANPYKNGTPVPPTPPATGGGSPPVDLPILQVNDMIQFKSTINLRSGAGTNNGAIGKANNGDTGVIVGGPTQKDGYNWYQIDKTGQGKVWAAHGQSGGQAWFIKTGVKPGGGGQTPTPVPTPTPRPAPTPTPTNTPWVDPSWPCQRQGQNCATDYLCSQHCPGVGTASSFLLFSVSSSFSLHFSFVLVYLLPLVLPLSLHFLFRPSHPSFSIIYPYTHSLPSQGTKWYNAINEALATAQAITRTVLGVALPHGTILAPPAITRPFLPTTPLCGPPLLPIVGCA